MKEHGLPESKLTVIKRVENSPSGQAMWLCQCECGSEPKILKGTCIRSLKKPTLSCGCMQREATSKINRNKIKPGDVFGRLTILEELKERNNKGDIQYKCQCSCKDKTICIKNSTLIKTGKSLSCGCLQKEQLVERNNQNREKNSIVGQVFGHLTVLEETDKRTKNQSMLYKCQCDCPNKTIVYITSSNLKSGNSTSCGCDKSSKGEKIITSILLEEGIDFIPQWDNNGIFRYEKTNYPIKFDFYLPDFNTCIEYDGIQHITGWSGDSEDLKKIQKKDNIRNNICKNNNIKLIRIPYTDEKLITWDYIKEKINEI